MRRSELEHLIRASGSQAVLGQFPNAPGRLLMSMEADIFPKYYPDRADKVDGAIGEGSSFHEMIHKDTMLERLAETDLEKSVRESFLTRIKSLFTA